MSGDALLEKLKQMKEADVDRVMWDFRLLVEQYDLSSVMKRMDEQTYWKLYKYFNIERF